MTKVTVWICPEHGEMEILEVLEKAFCPKCGYFGRFSDVYCPKCGTKLTPAEEIDLE